ncbi:DUF1064 domain-containing protein [Fructilactobacillus cliffordii]|uniref:DUF1064 domain-containing protein n=1 Tax=Fructilactobacillus cliffordii TaxID=2940299 RepID=UPI003B84B1A2
MVKISTQAISNWKTRERSLKSTWNKYHAKKISYAGIVWDSKAELAYYMQHIEGTDQKWDRQKKFTLIPSFQVGSKKKRARSYKPDFCIYDNDGITCYHFLAS